MLYKITIDKGSTYEYKIINYETLKDSIEIIDIVPFDEKLFNGDIIDFVDNKCTIVNSSIRNVSYIQGILICEGNKTYGRFKNKYLYKCIPDDKRLPTFLIPYEIQGKTFTKYFKNKYVNFKFKHWNEKHPCGELIHTIGDVDILENFYEYQLYCKSLNASIQDFTKKTLKKIKERTLDEYTEHILRENPYIRDHRNRTIYTIDGKNTQDFDDAIYCTKTISATYNMCIYISNVTLWIDILNLWESFSNRISTIYLPDRKRPMLPTILSDCLCSLQKNQNRFAFVLDLTINNNGEIIENEYYNSIINVTENYEYEEKKLIHNKNYIIALQCAQLMCQHKKYISCVKNSNDLITYLMIMTNHFAALSFKKRKNGIFRSSTINENISLPNTLNEDVLKFMQIWRANAGEYTKQNTNNTHMILKLDAYSHITSPIRRIIDLLNLIQIQENEYLYTFNEKAHQFLNNWIEQLEYINVTMRAIRKVQTQCSLLDIIFKNPQIENTNYTGFVFDKIQRNDGLFQYMVYLSQLKMVSKITTCINKNNYQMCYFNIYKFKDAENFKQKVRINMIE